MVEKAKLCAGIIPTWMQHESLFSCLKTLVTCRRRAIWWWVKCSDILGDTIKLRHIMYLLLDLARFSIFLKQHCGGGKRWATLSFLRIHQYRVTVEPFFFHPIERAITTRNYHQAPLEKKKTHTHSYLANLRLPPRCCQSNRHLITEPQAQPATCRQTARHLRESDETHFIVLSHSKSCSHLPCLSWYNLKLCHVAGCCWMANWFRPPIVSQCATTCCM